MNPAMRKLFNFSPQENKIFQILQKKSWNISELAPLTGFPRTTLYTALDSLESRGLITRRKEGKAVIVASLPRTTITQKIHSTAVGFSRYGSIQIQPEEHHSHIRFIYGKEELFKIWKKITEKGNKRVYIIQPSNSLVHTVTKFPPGAFIPINEAVKRNKIIIEAIIREDNLQRYLELYKGDRKIQKSIVQSFIGRMADTTLVANEYLNHNADLIISGDIVFLINWQEEIGLEIKNRDISELLKELFTLTKSHGKKVNFNEYIRKYL